MTEAEAALKIGENIGTILVIVAKVPVLLAAPIVSLLSCGAFFWGKRYERKHGKSEKVLMEDLSNIVINTNEGEENDSENNADIR